MDRDSTGSSCLSSRRARYRQNPCGAARAADGHKSDDDKRTYILPKDELYVPPYQIPLRCLVPRDGRNLLRAGRCMSADQLALSSARVTTTCSILGQAASIGAAMAASRGADAADLDPLEVRREVERRGAHLAVDVTPPPQGAHALTPDAVLGELALAAPPIGNTLIRWTIGN